MRIEAMTATFGRFDRETLTLQPGLNILTAPNEAGKSTWCAFLLAMLYGIDTAERATKSNFPAKTHYKPWSGAAMEGLMQVVHNGRRITLERTSTAKSPMGVFRAYDTETGAPIPELTADTCGQILLGVPRAVFERSAFIRQGGIGISMDAGLEQRLNALVTTGDERISYIEAEKKLRDLRNRCRHNKTGLIPQIQAELTQTEQTLEQIRQLQSQASELQLQQTELQGSVQTCRRQLQTLQAREASAQRKQLDEARDEALRQLDLAKALEQQCACLPEVSILQQWQQQLEQLRGRRHTLELDAALTTCSAVQPEPPQILAGLDSGQAWQKAADDSRHALELQRRLKPGWLPFLLPGFILVILAGVLPGQKLQLPAIAAGVAAVIALIAGAILFARKHGVWKQSHAACLALLQDYGVQTPEEIAGVGERYSAKLEQYQNARRAYQNEQQQQQEALAALQTEQASLLETIQTRLGDSADPQAAIAAALQARLQMELAQRDASQAYRHYDALKQAVGELPELEDLPDEPLPAGATQAALCSRLQQLEQTLAQVSATLARAEGRRTMLGDRIELEARRQQLSDRLDALTLEHDALGVALVALQKANETLQTRFSPQLTALTGQYMDRLTGGSYSRVLLDRELNLDLYPDQTPASRSAAYFSRGTCDQLYLALRLAVGDLLLGKDVPLVLDDALVSFDDNRLQLALQVLQEQPRQILLFTCQNREQALLHR